LTVIVRTTHMKNPIIIAFDCHACLHLDGLKDNQQDVGPAKRDAWSDQIALILESVP
jgi:hypothetical protein